MPTTRPQEHPIAIFDIAVIGGGINGAGIAADAAGRGLSVFLCEKDDLARHTSSASSKLIHGGLRYLEHYEFRLVREALAEREVLLAKAPHLIKPLRFVLPHRPHLRPAWMIRAGLFLYDHLGKREKLPASRGVRFDKRSPLKSEIKRGFEYSDCWVDDARLVLINIQAAHELGAQIETHTRCLSAKRNAGIWELDMQHSDGHCYSIRTRALVNASGPWVASFIREDLQQQSPYGIRLIQGSHIIVPRLYSGDHAYILQNEDGRIVFATPYEENYTLIGTTDQEYKGDPGKVAITDAEIDYVLAVSNAHFKQQLSRDDVLHSFSGVRPLCDDESDNPSAITRDYTLSLSSESDEAPLLSVFGGKLTTYRKLAESALKKLAPFFPEMGPAWTASARLPGGEGMNCPAELSSELATRHTWLDKSLADRWARTYGTRTWRLIGDASGIAALGEYYGAGLYQREVDYMIEHEWVTEVEDILWRRTKLGLDFTAEAQTRLQQYLQSRTTQEVSLPSTTHQH